MLAHTSSSSALPQGVWRASQCRHETVTTLSSGFPELDAVLPGQGWPIGRLTELLSCQNGIGELRLLAPLLHTLTTQSKPVLVVAPPYRPYPPGLLAYGIDLSSLILLDPPTLRERLWSLDQALRSACFGAILAWIPQALRYTDLQRLNVAAQDAPGPVLVFRTAEAQDQPSPAPLRAFLRPHGRLQIAVHVLKRRGTTLHQAVLIKFPPLLTTIPDAPGKAHTKHVGTRNPESETM
jgi:protein ImuA